MVNLVDGRHALGEMYAWGLPVNSMGGSGFLCDLRIECAGPVHEIAASPVGIGSTGSLRVYFFFFGCGFSTGQK